MMPPQPIRPPFPAPPPPQPPRANPVAPALHPPQAVAPAKTGAKKDKPELSSSPVLSEIDETFKAIKKHLKDISESGDEADEDADDSGRKRKPRGKTKPREMRPDHSPGHRSHTDPLRSILRRDGQLAIDANKRFEELEGPDELDRIESTSDLPRLVLGMQAPNEIPRQLLLEDGTGSLFDNILDNLERQEKIKLSDFQQEQQSLDLIPLPDISRSVITSQSVSAPSSPAPISINDSEESQVNLITQSPPAQITDLGPIASTSRLSPVATEFAFEPSLPTSLPALPPIQDALQTITYTEPAADSFDVAFRQLEWHDPPLPSTSHSINLFDRPPQDLYPHFDRYPTFSFAFPQPASEPAFAQAQDHQPPSWFNLPRSLPTLHDVPIVRPEEHQPWDHQAQAQEERQEAPRESEASEETETVAVVQADGTVVYQQQTRNVYT